MAAPASAASMAACAISSGVTGRWGDMEGVWIAPVTAQVMMTLRGAAMASSSELGLRGLVGSKSREQPVPAGALVRDALASGSDAPRGQNLCDVRVGPDLVGGWIGAEPAEERGVAGTVIRHAARRI